MRKKKIKVPTATLNPRTFFQIHNIEIEAQRLIIHKLLKKLSKAHDIIDRYESIIEQCEQNCEQETSRLLDESAERVSDHFASQEIDFLEKVKTVIGKTILGKSTKAALMEALAKINDLVDKEMDSIEKGDGETAEQERPADGQTAGKE